MRQTFLPLITFIGWLLIGCVSTGPPAVDDSESVPKQTVQAQCETWIQHNMHAAAQRRQGGVSVQAVAMEFAMIATANDMNIKYRDATIELIVTMYGEDSSAVMAAYEKAVRACVSS